MKEVINKILFLVSTIAFLSTIYVNYSKIVEFIVISASMIVFIYCILSNNGRNKYLKVFTVLVYVCVLLISFYRYIFL